jgi:hypothetical protein
MEQTRSSPNRATYARSGAVAGVVSALAFALVHDLLISDIWFSAIFMMIAAALCGLCIGWSYGQLARQRSLTTWVGYNLLYVIFLVLLGLVSVLFFEPVMTLAALMVLNGPPHDLIGQALPMTLLFTVAYAAVVSLFYGPGWRHFGIVQLTATVLVLLLGLNISALGLVSIPRGSLYLVAEFLGLVVLINAVYVITFIALERRSLTSGARKLRLGQSARISRQA